MNKRRWFVRCIILLTLILTACGTNTANGQTTATKPLSTTTKLSAAGTITKNQLATIKGKTGTYYFTGSNHHIKYQWAYSALQIQNPTRQKLGITFTTTGLNAIKRAANNAPVALGFRLQDFHLAGSPTLTITIPKKWHANTLKLVAKQHGQLRTLNDAHATVHVRQNSTTIKLRITSVDGTYYLVGGYNQAVAKQQAQAAKSKAKSGTKAASTSTTGQGKSADNQSKNNQKSATSQTKQEATNNAAGGASSDTSTTNNNGNGTASNGSSSTGNANDTKSSSNDSNHITVTMSISTSTILQNMDKVATNKKSLVPSSGWILRPTQVSISKTASVYDALVQVTKARGIQMESKYTPAYGAYYIQGIGNLYEFDVGNLSGWMYKVDGWFPNYGSSEYTTLKNGSTIQWVYTCDLGADVGDSQ